MFTHGCRTKSSSPTPLTVIALVGTALVAAIDASVQTIRAALPTPEQLEFTSGEVSVPMDDIGGRPVVEMRINGQGPYRFILDTGANRTVLSTDLIEELKLPAANDTPGAGPVKVAELRLHTLVIRDSLVGRGGTMLAALGPNAPRGVLSAQSFPGALLILDFPGKRVRIRRGALPAADGRRSFQYAATDALPVVPVRIEGTEFGIHLDTGAPATISLPMKAAQLLKLDGQLVEKGRVRLATGEFPRYEAPFTGRAELGEYPLALEAIAFSDMRAAAEPKGVIGMLLIRDFVVTLDALNRRVSFDRAR